MPDPLDSRFAGLHGSLLCSAAYRRGKRARLNASLPLAAPLARLSLVPD